MHAPHPLFPFTGYDTLPAAKVFGEVVGNIGSDCISSKKYYHFVRLMGRSASHISLECALKVRRTLTLIPNPNP